MTHFFKEIIHRGSEIPNLHEKVILASSIVGSSIGAFIMAKDQKYYRKDLKECVCDGMVGSVFGGFVGGFIGLTLPISLPLVLVGSGIGAGFYTYEKNFE